MEYGMELTAYIYHCIDVMVVLILERSGGAESGWYHRDWIYSILRSHYLSYS
jgi:hypothetical protein